MLDHVSCPILLPQEAGATLFASEGSIFLLDVISLVVPSREHQPTALDLELRGLLQCPVAVAHLATIWVIAPQ